MFFRRKKKVPTVDNIMVGFNKMVEELKACVAHHTAERAKTLETIVELNNKSARHLEESTRADSVQAKIEAILK